MKILHVVASADPADGGVIEGVIQLGKAFEALGHEQELLTLDAPNAALRQTSNAKIHALGAVRASGDSVAAKLQRWARYSPDALDWLKAHIAEYDGVIVDGLWNYATHVARRVLPTASVPYLVFPHGMLDPWFAQKSPLKHAIKALLWRANEGPLLSHATAATFTTSRELELAKSAWRPWNSTDAIVGYGTNAPPAETSEMHEAFREAVPELGEKPYLLFMSRLHEKKGCEVLIEAYASAAHQLGCDLVMAGPGAPEYVRQLRHLAEQLTPAGSVHWPGMLAGLAKWGAIYGCQAMTLTSHQENFGVVVAETLGCSRPVIISDQVNIFEEVRSANAGLICRNAAESAELSLKEFAALDDDERRAMGSRGRALFNDKFDITQVAKRLIDIFEQAGGNSASGK